MAKLTIRSKTANAEGTLSVDGITPRFMSGNNVDVYIDDKKVSFCTYVNLEIKSGGLAEVTIKLIPTDLEIDV